MSTAELLRRARALIDEPGKWYPHAKSGGQCALAALGFPGHEPAHAVALAVLCEAAGVPNGCELFLWNDRSTHADVLAAYDRAIAAAEAAP